LPDITAHGPLSADDLALIDAAVALLERHYRPFWHMVAAAIRSRDGRIWTGIHLGATVGRLSVCAEAIALGRAIIEGDGTVEVAVAVRHPKPDEPDRTIAIVSPCGACRELLLDFDPAASVIIGAPPSLVPIRELLPTPYRR
jgi:cytidine deaminase